MARRLALLLGLFFPFSLPAGAQGRVELFGGYSYERLNTSLARNLNGVELTGQYKLKDWLGVAADLDGHFGSGARTLHFMVGPQISWPGRISPFVHVLAGVGRVHTGLSDTSFAAAIGGGIDMRLLPLLSWRIIQGDDVITSAFGATQHSVRLSTGIVMRF